MALEALASNDPSSYICKDVCIDNSTSTQQLASTISNNFFFQNNRALLSLPVFPGLNAAGLCANLDYYSYMLQSSPAPEKNDGGLNSSEHQQSRKKRRKRTRMCKNKEEAECQRMTHIAVERNRRKQMNEHLAMLRSLMPESYVQRGDQASIVGGAIDFVKELEQLLQSLEAQKQTRQQRGANNINNSSSQLSPFAQFFAFPHYSSCQIPGEFPVKNRSEIADVEVTMIETHANLRILSQKRPGQLLKIVTGFHNLRLTVLHLNVTTLDPMVLYSFSAKVEEDCYLKSVDDIALAVRHMLQIIDDEAGLMS